MNSYATERDYQRTVVDAAKRWGWRVHHCRPSADAHGRWRTAIQGHPGFPDLVLAHEFVPGVRFVELKHATGLTDEQERWGRVLVAAGADYSVVRTEEVDDYVHWLYDSTRGRGPS